MNEPDSIKKKSIIETNTMLRESTPRNAIKANPEN